jgi:two-component system response regulator PhoP
VRVLVVEDEPRLREGLVKSLHQSSFACVEAGSAAEAQYSVDNYPCDLILLDLGLPDGEGLALLRRWRDQGLDLPIIILTARADWQDKVSGLEAGADDYVTKPFQVEEVVARIKVALRRVRGRATDRSDFMGGVSISFDARRVWVGKQELSLTSFEFNLLALLAQSPGAVRSKTDLAEHLYDADEDRESNVLEVLVGRLRKKFASVMPDVVIETVRGSGYRFALESKVQ